ncbi:MAG: hypothetical protein HYV67_01635 [Candidatus Taylorbacteria bacterium]|nr:hypothetical protein [Candidatus Taylorbacteria bacterium]
MRNTFSSKLLQALLIAGATALVLSSPYAARQLLKGIRKEFSERKLKNSFYYLRQRGFIKYEERNGHAFLSLTKEGKRAAGQYSFFNKEKISRPPKWDKKWRLVLFDIATEHRSKRNALRFLLKRLGFVQFQKSAWLLPFECEKEVEDLKRFFNLSDDEVRLIVFDNIGNMNKYISFFKSN